MSEAGVIPPHWPREIGRMEDVDGVPIVFSLNLDGTVRITIIGFPPGSVVRHIVADLDKGSREQFMRLWCEAERQAEASDG